MNTRRPIDAVPGPDVTHERILHVLSITRRPLASAELLNALGLVNNEAHGAFDWLSRNGYIRRMEQAARSSTTPQTWLLADKGQAWIEGNAGRPVVAH